MTLMFAVSTSGWAWKFPGRLGDTPVIGAGNYCDDRYGAAACTGYGELAIRASTARSVVASLAAGMSVAEAASAALSDLESLDVPAAHRIMHVVAIDSAGRHCGASTRAGTTYLFRTAGMATFDRVPRLVVDPAP